MTTRLLNMLSILAGLIVVASSCTSTARIEKVQGADLSRYKTYGWIESSKEEESSQRRNAEITQQNIRSAVNKQLQKIGWNLSTLNPDVLVSADLVVEKSNKQLQDPVYSQPVTRTYYNRFTRRFNSFYYPSRFMGYDTYSTTVKEGTVTVTLIDAKTDKAMWQGWSTNELERTSISDKEITRNVQSIFKKFDNGN